MFDPAREELEAEYNARYDRWDGHRAEAKAEAEANYSCWLLDMAEDAEKEAAEADTLEAAAGEAAYNDNLMF